VKNGPSAHFVGDDLASAARRDQPTVDSQGHELDEGIEGLVLKRLAPLADHRGSLVPFLDARDEFWSEPVVYGYEIMIRPGRIKGWGMHELQTDRYLVANGKIRVVLYDGRTDHEATDASPSSSSPRRRPGYLRFPPACGTPTRIGATPTRASSTSRRVLTIPPTRTSFGSIPSRT
jgi:hypothetical protein